MYICHYQSPMGEIVLTASDEGLTSLTFVDGKKEVPVFNEQQKNETVFSEVIQQLDQYFAGTRQTFDLLLAPKGTAFQKKVWQALTQIKQGKTQSYLGLAKAINNEKAVRAVGTANGANPITLIIPCHRVIGSDGKLTGYAGGLALKAKLLMHEGAHFKP